MTRASTKLVVAALVATIAACGGSTGPVAGILKVKLVGTPNSGLDGAILLSVTAPTIPSAATAQGGFRLFGTPTATTSTFAVTGTLSAGSVLFTIAVADISKVGQYSATVQQVAASSTFALRSLTNYSLSVTQ
ncbi:MAG TPA: hypothetical protein VEO93_09450 [Gemmatimonadales bacterium]|nr:hypothetical protein [Gemmatimonadales bacterium]